MTPLPTSKLPWEAGGGCFLTLDRSTKDPLCSQETRVPAEAAKCQAIPAAICFSAPLP